MRTRLEPSRDDKQFAVPENYFENFGERVIKQIEEEKLKRAAPINSRMIYLRWTAIGAAAMACGLIFFVWKPARHHQHLRFAEEINRTELTEDDLPYFTDKDEVFEYYLEDAEWLFSDTIKPDSSAAKRIVSTIKNDKPKVALDPKTGLPLDPSSKKKEIKWSDLSTDEMIQYLMEESDDNEINN
jgi:glycerol kinase